MSSSRRRLEEGELEKFVTAAPPNILIDILARLPLKTIFATRCVCKDFLSFLIYPNPQFAQLHSATASQTLILQFGDVSKPSKMLRLIEPELDIAPENVKDFILRPLFEMPKVRKGAGILYRTKSEYFQFVIVNSCNGLLYFVRREGLDERSLVCNPVTKEYVVIPDVDLESRSSTETKGMWLGFSPRTNQYKVLRIFISVNDVQALEFGAQVLVVGTDSWKKVESIPLGDDLSWDSCFTTLNGDTYWLDYLKQEIVFFDFDKEMFGYITLPEEFGQQELANKRFTSIGILQGRLCLSYNAFNDKRLDLWILKKQGNRDSWSKEYVVDTKRRYGRQLYGLLRPLQVLRNGEILLYWDRYDLVCYDPKSKSLRLVKFYWLESNPRIVAFTPSFIPLKVALSVDKVMLQYARPRGTEKEP